jgi:hypothetical protein
MAMQIHWRRVIDPAKACQRLEAKSVVGGPETLPVTPVTSRRSVTDDKKCIIYTGESPSDASLGGNRFLSGVIFNGQ